MQSASIRDLILHISLGVSKFKYRNRKTEVNRDIEFLIELCLL